MLELLQLPPNYSTHGGEIDQLMLYVHVIMVVLFIGWFTYFVFLLVRFRAKANPSGNYAGVKSSFSKYLEVAVALVEVVLLLGFSIPLYAKRVGAFPKPDDALEIHLVAEQFAWNLHYAGEDGIFGQRDASLVDSATNPIGLDRESEGGADDIVKVNQLHIPVGKPIIIHLTSKDVIHCFNLPFMRVKQDVIPGMSIPVWFEATDTVKTEIACAQLCGLGHYRMKGYLTIETQAEFDQWLADEAAALTEASEDDFWD